MAQDNCAASLELCMVRLARLAADGTTPAGATNGYISDLMAKLSFNPNTQAGDDIVIKDSCGKVRFTYKSRDQLKRLDLQLEILTPDPEIHELLVGSQLITSGGKSIGFQYPRIGAVPSGGVCLEGYSKRLLPGGGQDLTVPWYHHIFPATYWALAGRTADANPMAVIFDGFAIENANIGNGPWNDWPAGIVAAAATFNEVTLPTAVCGYSAVPTQV